VTGVIRTPKGVTVTTTSGTAYNFDRVILACHGDQALRLLAGPTPDEFRLLSAFRYQPNLATVHTDASVMPRTRRAWASWNYELARAPDGQAIAATHYWMNSLQGVSDLENYFVSINGSAAINPDKIIRKIPYEHPLFSLAAIRAQAELPQLNAAAAGTTETFFAGSYFRYGFHEDALLSAFNLSQLLLGGDPWAAV
jgi:predicted NAD/FAD-binding protein